MNLASSFSSGTQQISKTRMFSASDTAEGFLGYLPWPNFHLTFYLTLWIWFLTLLSFKSFHISGKTIYKIINKEKFCTYECNKYNLKCICINYIYDLKVLEARFYLFKRQRVMEILITSIYNIVHTNIVHKCNELYEMQWKVFVCSWVKPDIR